MPGVNLRRAAVADAAVLGELAVRSKAHWGYSRDFLRACRDKLQVPSTQINRGWVTVAKVDGDIAGFAGIAALNEARCDLTHLFVDPARLRHGIGAALLSAVRLQAARAGARILEVQSDPHAADFYADQGGQSAGSEPSQSIPGRMLACFEFTCAAAEE